MVLCESPSWFEGCVTAQSRSGRSAVKGLEGASKGETHPSMADELPLAERYWCDILDEWPLAGILVVFGRPG